MTNLAIIWPSISSPLMQYLLGDDSKLSVMCSFLPQQSPLKNWIPDRSDIKAFKTAIGSIDRLKTASYVPSAKDFAAIATAFEHPGEHWLALRDLAVAHLVSLGHADAIHAAISQKAKPPVQSLQAKLSTATWTPPPASCRDAWGRLLPAWMAAGIEGSHESLTALNKNYRTKGWQGSLPTAWRPNLEEARRLKGLDSLRKRVFSASGDRRPGFIQQMLGEIRLLGPMSENCLMLAKHYFEARSIDLEHIQDANVAVPKASRIRQRRADPVTPVPVIPLTIGATPRAPIELTTSQISIFIDEVETQSHKGAIAGIVWFGPASSVPHESLQKIRTHHRNPQPLSALLSCPRAYPFIVPVQVSPGVRANYLTMVRTTVQILLGWMLPQPNQTVQVEVFLELFGPYLPGNDHTAFFAGALDEAKVDYPDHFGRWSISKVQWQDKDFGYIPWGDLLGYWYFKQVVSGQAFGPEDCTKLPGYLPIDAEGYSKMRAVCRQPTPQGILDLAASLGDCHLSRVLMKDLRRQCEQNVDLIQALLTELDRRYHDDQRDLRRLKSQLEAVRALVGPLSEKAPLALRLHMLALDLQDANHDGDPQRVAGLEQRYLSLRETALELDHDLVAHIDANLAVHATDRGDFTHACEILEWLSEDPRFPYLTPVSRGRHLSSLGQQLSIAGCHAEADDRFAAALELFDRDPKLTARQRERERTQTLTYRTINALDGGLELGSSLLCELLGGEPEKALDFLKLMSKPELIALQYQHHVLLRHAWFVNETNLSQAIIALQPSWSHLLPQHPWELIGLYRALIVWRDGPEDEDCQDLFTLAARCIEYAGSGAALTMIRCAVALCGAVCTDDSGLLELARSDLMSTEAHMGADHTITSDLRECLSTIETLADEVEEDLLIDLINRILTALPFNYR